MRKLILAELCTYLPYELEIRAFDMNDGKEKTFALIGIISGMVCLIDDKESSHYDLNEIKPILRPLSDIRTFHDEDEGSLISILYNIAGLDIDFELDINIGDLCENSNYLDIRKCYDTFQILLKYHFDVFGLIEAGIAIDINTISHA